MTMTLQNRAHGMLGLLFLGCGLGVFLGALGVHNFYAGYTGRAVGQLCLSVLTLFYLAVASWIWAIVEICTIDKDSSGLQFN